MAKLVVTGGAGFLGYHICNHLKNKFDEFLVIDIDKFYSDEYPKNTKYLKLDIRDYENLKTALKGYDLIVHGAAALPLWKPKDIWTVNVDGTKNVLNAAIENNIKRVVFISSTAVYGVPKKTSYL